MNVWIGIFCAVCVYLSGMVSAACAAREGSSTGTYRGCNVILIIADSLRPDYLHFYGYGKKTTPHLNRLAQQSSIFTRAYCQIPLTFPSVVSLFTSVYPSSHNALYIFKDAVPKSLYTLAQILQFYGYETAWFGTLDDPHSGSAPGLLRGFAHKAADARYNEHRGTTCSAGTSLSSLRLIKKISFSPPLRWVAANHRDPFFLVIHSYLPHNQVYPFAEFPNIFSKKLPRETKRWLSYVQDTIKLQEQMNGCEGDGRRPSSALSNASPVKFSALLPLLDSAIFEFDKELIGPLIAILEENNAIKNTMIIITADHGDEHEEHGYIGHGYHLYEPSVRVPLVMYLPYSKKPQCIDALVQAIDIMPTILDALGVPIPVQAQGKSMIDLLEGHPARSFNDYVFSETIDGTCAVRSPGWKLILHSAEAGQENELYNLEDDPSERKNLIHGKTAEVERLRAALEEWKRSLPAYGATQREFLPAIDKETQERIKKTGYW